MVLNLSAFETRGKKTSKLNLSAFGIKKKEAMSPSFKLNAPAPSLGLGGVSTPATLAPGSEPLGALVKGVGQGFARGTAATGARLASQVSLATDDIVDPNTYFGKPEIGRAVFGKEEPFNATTEDIELLEAFGADPNVAAGTGGSLTLLLSALDVTGAGGGARGLAGAVRNIKAAKDIAAALKVAKSVGLADDIAEQYEQLKIDANVEKGEIDDEHLNKTGEAYKSFVKNILPELVRNYNLNEKDIFKMCGGVISKSRIKNFLESSSIIVEHKKNIISMQKITNKNEHIVLPPLVMSTLKKE